MRIVVVGASIAGFSAAQAARKAGHDGEIVLIGTEPRRTYERPPLSKGVLTGDDVASVAWSAAVSDDLDVSWRTGRTAVGLDPAARIVHLDEGTERYDGLVIATGAIPRSLPGTEAMAGVFVLRTLDDSIALRSALEARPRRVVVIGAGFIGAEVAASCRALDLEVTVVEPMPSPMHRIVGDAIGGVVADMHRDRGVDIRTGVGVDAVLGDGHVTGVRLADGTELDADVVVVGIGVAPATGWLEGSGLPVDNGVVADETLLVAPGIVAAGDVASWHSPRYGRVRIEHWDHAVDMGAAAGRRLLVTDADAEPYDPVPWFWSDQYDTRIQVAGRISGDDEVVIADGAVENRKFVALYGRDGEVRGALGWNWPAKTVRYRMALEAGTATWPT